MRIAIFGVGAMGCLFGARLAPHADVMLIGHWQQQIDHLNRQPLQIKYPRRAEMDEVQLKATTDPASIAPVDIALILTKSNRTQRVAAEAAGILTGDGIAITLQNGLENYTLLRQYVGDRRASLGVTAQGAAVEAVGVIRYGGTGDTYLATRPDIHDRVQALAELFNNADIRTHLTEDIEGILWGKLAVNAAINPLTALLRMTNGELVISDWARDLLHEAAVEVQRVAQAQNIDLPYRDAAQQVEQVARLTGQNRSSMLQDVLRGAETEIENINGAIMRRGEIVGVPTPVNAMLYRLVKAIDEMRGA
ncbi:MAG: 2-dehydropantoate 2-reductase [Chloroflexi bacterium]|nr:2-dehydropantoate 2-reductase [Chloroflexota bacterium]